MALTISLVDYSPLYNALATQRAAGGLVVQRKALELRQKDISRQATADLLQLASEAAKTVYGIFQQGALEKTKKQVIENETWYSQQIQKGLSEGSVTFKDGELIIPPELQTEYDVRQAAIEKEVKGYPEVHAWAVDQGAQIKQRGILHALSVAEPIAKATREALGKETLTTALDQSVAQGKLDPYYAAIAGQTWRSPDEKALLRQLGEQDFDFRSREGGIRNLVSVGGYDAGATAVEAWRKSGEVTSEQADSLLNTAANQGSVQGVVYAQQSQAAYQKMVDAGVDAEVAVKMVVKGIPEAYRGKTEELLRAAKETAETRADTSGDEKMQDYYQKNRDDPAALRAFLDLPANGFSKAMNRETYMYWDSKIDSKLKGPPEPETPPQFLNEMRSVISDNWKYPTTDLKKKEIQKIARRRDSQGNFPVTADDYKAYLSMAADETFLESLVVNQLDVIHNNFEALRQKDKANAEKYTHQENQVIQQFTDQLKRGERSARELEALTSRLLHPTKAAVFFIDQAGDMSGRARADQRRNEVLTLLSSGRTLDPRASLSDEERISMRSFDLQRIRDQVGVGVDKGVDFVSANGTDGTDEQANGLPMFYVKGLDRKNPDRAFTVRFALDPKGRVELQTLDTTGNWVSTGYKFKTVVAEEKAAAAAIAKAERQKRIAASVPTSAGVAALREAAVKEGMELEEAAGVVAKAGPAPNIEQIQTLLMVKGFLRTKRMTEVDVQAIAKQVGTTPAAVLIAVRAQGVEVVK